MRTVNTTYALPVHTPGGGWLRDELVEITAECEQFGDDVLVIWTDETLAKLASLDLDGEELVGCDEAATEAFWASEQEACRVASVRQRLGKGVAA